MIEIQKKDSDLSSSSSSITSRTSSDSALSSISSNNLATSSNYIPKSISLQPSRANESSFSLRIRNTTKNSNLLTNKVAAQKIKLNPSSDTNSINSFQHYSASNHAINELNSTTSTNYYNNQNNNSHKSLLFMNKIDDAKNFVASAYSNMNKMRENYSYRARTGFSVSPIRSSSRIQNNGSAFSSQLSPSSSMKSCNSNASNCSTKLTTINDTICKSKEKNSAENTSINQDGNAFESFSEHHNESIRNFSKSSLNISKLENDNLFGSMQKDVVFENMRKSLEYSEERRKLLLEKFREAQSLLQIHLGHSQSTVDELKAKYDEVNLLQQELENQKALNAKMTSEMSAYVDYKNQQELLSEQFHSRTRQLECWIKEYKSELHKLKNDCKEKTNLIDSLMQNKTCLNMEKSQIEIEYSQLKINLNEVRNENSELKLRQASFDKEILRLQSQITEFNKDYDKMQELLTEREKNWTNLKAKLEECLASREQLHNDNLTLTNQVNELKELNELQESRLSEINYLLELKENEKESLKGELASYKEAHESLNNELSSCRKANDDLKPNISKLIEKIKSMKFDFDKLNEEKQMLERKIESIGTENHFEKIKDEITKLNEEKSNLLSENDSYKKQLNELTKKYEEDFQKLKYEKIECERLIKSKDNELQELKEQLKNSHGDLKKYSQVEENYKLMEYEFEEKLISLNEDVERLGKENHALKIKCDEYEQLNEFLETQLKVFKEQQQQNSFFSNSCSFTNSNGFEQDSSAKDKTIKDLNKKCSDLEANEVELNRELTRLSQKCQAYENEIRSLKENLEDLQIYKEESEAQMAENQGLMKRYKNLEKEFNALNLNHQKTIENLKNSKESEIFTLRQKLDLCEAQLKQSYDKINELNKDYITVKDKSRELELQFERDKSSKILIDNECSELKQKIKRLQNDVNENQTHSKRNEENSMRFKSQINDLVTEIQCLKSQLADSKDVQEKQDCLIKSLKEELDYDKKKGEKLKKYEFEVESTKNEVAKYKNLLDLQVKENDILMNTNNKNREKIKTLEDTIQELLNDNKDTNKKSDANGKSKIPIKNQKEGKIIEQK